MACPLIVAQQQVVIPEISISALIGMISPLVGAVGVIIMVLGAYKSALRFFMPDRSNPADPAGRSFAPFTRHLSLGLEFLIAASAIRLVAGADLQGIGMLFGLVFGRIVIGLCQRWESGLPQPAELQMARTLLPPAAGTHVSGNGHETFGLPRQASVQDVPTNGAAAAPEYAAPLTGAAAS